jgi:tetratricopeptide (TPR) repeat protein
VLDALAVLARPSSEGLVAAATGLEPSVVAGALREGTERHVLVRSTGNEPLFAFRHALMQEAIYDELLGTERVRIHRAVGSALATPGLLAGSSNVDAELAFHFRRGRQPELALPAAARAGRDAASRYAYPEALREWEQVLDLWEQVGDPETLAGVDHADATAAAAEMASIIGDHRRAVGLIRAALGEVDPASEPVRAARGQAFLMTELFSAGDADGSEVARREALALLERQPPSLEHVAVLNAASYPPLFASRYAEVAELAARALEIAEHHGAVAEAGWAHVPLGTAIAFLGRLDEGRTHIAEALRIARESGQPQALVDAYLADGIVLEAAGRFEDAVSVMEAGLAALRDIGVERTHGTTLRSDMAEALRRLGRWRESLEHVEALLRYERSGWELAHASVLRGHLLAGMGRAEEADEALQTAWEHFGRAGTGFLGHCYAARAENELWRGRPHAARQLAAAGLDEIRATRDLRWIGELTVLAVRALALGGESDGPPAGTAADELLFRLDGDIAAGLTVGTLFVPEVYGYRSLSQAEARRMSGAHDPDAWHDAAARWLALRQPYPRAYAELRAAEAILTAGGDRHAAARSAASAAEAARGLARHPCFGRSRH